MVSRLHAKTNQIGKLLNNLEKYNHLMKDAECGRSPTTPGGGNKSFLKNSPTSPRVPVNESNRFLQQADSDRIKQQTTVSPEAPAEKANDC